MSCVWMGFLARDFSLGWRTLYQVAPQRRLLHVVGSRLAQDPPQAPDGSTGKAAGDSQLTLGAPSGQGQDGAARALVPFEDFFQRASGGFKDKAGFTRAVDVFNQRSVRKRGHVDFIYTALGKMKEYGVERDLAVYNLLLDVFPKEVFVPRNFIQRIFNHYPRQQECGVQVLEQMENHGVLPNKETEFLLLQVFGRKSYPMLKYHRIMYWFPRFKNINPFPLPKPLPQDPVDLARLGLQRIAADLSARVTVYQMPEAAESPAGAGVLFRPHIIGIQSPDQQAALARHSPSRPIFIEGPFPLWLRDKCVYYHILRADLVAGEKEEEELGPERNFYCPMQLDLDLDRGPWDDNEFDVDEVEEGPVFAMCMAGAHDQDTLAQWILRLQETNPALAQIPVVFRLGNQPHELQLAGQTEEQQPHPEEFLQQQQS
ncbi:evolutionarily conserved signaling intermediate in Toll pathway, mitochondrial [Tachyglossus aculeatus]|uniref:evolutionarily conserved signaling intermediate in Toll pathway, mitochondrial n=1 Tax=Tachyglossus aculeatus TaxID=9261 RepID=UPI0018F5AEBB|nr:evolutionarily conserved signaling intermediate in Toll pathway, mitochondrial [Tachyglossus aculeatus]XP_038626601.1 evolutionarily conserved signaling intermediate in Toll pathway, mitochondrial [Tachyglossus aculeatus]